MQIPTKKSKSQLTTGSYIKEFSQVALSTTSVIIPQNSKSQKAFSPPIYVKVWAPLSAAASKPQVIDRVIVRDKCSDSLALWHCLRAINSWGSGFLDFDMALDSLISTFHFSARTAYRQLNKGNNVFWTLTYHNAQRRIQIYSLKMVSQYLDTYLSGDKHSRLIPVESFCSLKKRRSELYASIHKPKFNKDGKRIKSNPIDRISIEKITGISRMQQWRYEKVARVTHVATFETKEDKDGNICRKKHEVYSYNNKTKIRRVWLKDKRLGNIYHSSHLPGCVGMAKRISNELRPKNESSLKVAGASSKLLKRFFKSLTKLIKCKHKAGDSHYLVPRWRRVIKGRVEWCIHTT